jgi:CubicO group peptidase (beta-lactamase class C family)
VLSHSSGLPHGRPEGTPISLRFTPGERFAYSATGIQYLQMVIERLSGQPFADFMKARVLDPFGMNSSNFGWIKRYEKEAAQGHWRDGSTGLTGNGKYLAATAEELERMRRHYPEFKYPSASAGLYATASDYARFMIEVIDPSGQDRFHLSEAIVTEMLKPQVRINDSISWGLGWGIERTDAGDAFWHWGDWGVFRNFAIASRKQRTGVVVLTNSFNGPKVYRDIVPAAIGGEHPALAWVDRYRP